jgi:hypothetical protein
MTSGNQCRYRPLLSITASVAVDTPEMNAEHLGALSMAQALSQSIKTVVQLYTPLIHQSF